MQRHQLILGSVLILKFNIIVVLFRNGFTLGGEKKIPSWHVGANLEEAQKINPALSRTEQPNRAGRPARDLRQVLEGIFHILRGGYPWRDLPERFGPWQTIYGRFRRWCQEGLWAEVLTELSKGAKGKLRFIDGSYIRVHQDGAPSLQRAEDECVGTSRGGRNSKLHALVDLHGRALKLIITPGSAHDIRAAPQLIANLHEAIVVADKGYDSAAFRSQITVAGNRSCIPKRKGAKSSAPYNRFHYKKRARVENFFARIKRFRRVSTRYEKSKRSFEGFILFASILDWIR
ncbi:MAG: IS5 family transposase [Verrucomicrobiota bacterium]